LHLRPDGHQLSAELLHVQEQLGPHLVGVRAPRPGCARLLFELLQAGVRLGHGLEKVSGHLIEPVGNRVGRGLHQCSPRDGVELGLPPLKKGAEGPQDSGDVLARLRRHGPVRHAIRRNDAPHELQPLLALLRQLSRHQSQKIAL
jgi:hypothetical protein